MNAYINTPVHTELHTCTHEYIQKYTCEYTHICIYIHTYMHTQHTPLNIHAYIHTYYYLHAYRRAHACKDITYIYTYLRTYKQASMHTYTPTCIHIHACIIQVYNTCMYIHTCIFKQKKMQQSSRKSIPRSCYHQREPPTKRTNESQRSPGNNYALVINIKQVKRASSHRSTSHYGLRVEAYGYKQ